MTINYDNIYQAIKALNQCAKEYENKQADTGGIRVSDLCTDVAYFLSKVYQDHKKIEGIPMDVLLRSIDNETYDRLKALGILDSSVRAYNRGTSDYSKHIIQPWSIWLDYELNPWDADIVKRVLRDKENEPRRMDYEKIIHICEERIRQIDINEKEKG